MASSKGDIMKKLMLVKEVNVKTLVSGDKSCRVVLESLSPEDIEELSKLSNETEIEVEFLTPKEK